MGRYRLRARAGWYSVLIGESNVAIDPAIGGLWRCRYISRGVFTSVTVTVTPSRPGKFDGTLSVAENDTVNNSGFKLNAIMASS